MEKSVIFLLNIIVQYYNLILQGDADEELTAIHGYWPDTFINVPEAYIALKVIPLNYFSHAVSKIYFGLPMFSLAEAKLQVIKNDIFMGRLAVSVLSRILYIYID